MHRKSAADMEVQAKAYHQTHCLQFTSHCYFYIVELIGARCHRNADVQRICCPRHVKKDQPGDEQNRITDTLVAPMERLVGVVRSMPASVAN